MMKNILLLIILFIQKNLQLTLKGNCIQNNKNYEFNLKLYLNEEKESRVDKWGNFVFYNIEEGFHSLRVGSIKSQYPEYQINVQDNNVIVHYYDPNMKKWNQIPYPLTIQPISEIKYFEIPEEFRLDKILKSPMGIMICVFIGLFLCMKSMPDMEELQKAERQQRN